MLRELITWILNTYLGKYIEDFNPAQLSVALLSGEVELENVPIRKDALKAFGIPIQVRCGIIGKIKLRIPIYQFKTAPWCVTVEHLYVVFGPKDVNDWDCQEEKTSDFEVKISELNTTEALWRAQKGYYNESFYYTTSYTNWLSYGSSIATNILDNLELRIDHVHLRYEDLSTVPDNNFAFGLKIGSLTIQSTDCDWNPSPKELREDEYAYKLIQLNDFAVYADQIGVNNIWGNLKSDELLERMGTFRYSQGHKFLLIPVSVCGQLKRQRSQPSSRKNICRKISCKVLASEIKVVVNEDQYKQIVGCYIGLKEVNILRSFKMFRPDKSIFENASAWWQYAARCYGCTFETKGEKWEKLKENLRYINIYKRFLSNSVISGEEKEFKSFVERKRTLIELITLRNICFNSITLNTNVDSSHHSNHGKSMLFHWFPSWWGWYGNTSSDVVESNPKVDVDALQNIEDKILNVIEDAFESNSYLKKELSFGNFSMELSIGEIFIFIESSAVDIAKTMIEISIKAINTIYEIRSRSESFAISLSIESINVKDYITPDTEFVDLIRSHKKEYIGLSYLSVCNVSSNLETCRHWLHIQFEKKLIGFNTDIRVLIKCNSLDIIYNTAVYKWLVGFITSQQKGRNFRNLLKNRKEVKATFPRKWRRFIFGSLEDRYSWSFEVDIAAPHIIFVENPSDKNSSVLSVQIGECRIFKGYAVQKTNLNVRAEGLNIKNVIEQLNNNADYDADSDMFLTPCSTPPVSASSYPDSPDVNSETSKCSKNYETKLENSLRDKLYDKYTIALRDFQVILKPNVHGSSGISESSIFQFIDKFNLSMEFEMRKIHTTDRDYPLFIFLVTLPNLVIHISDKYTSSFFNIASSLFPHESNIIDENQQQTISFLNNYDERYSIRHLRHFLIEFKINQLILELQSKQQSLVELQTTGIDVRFMKEFDKANLRLTILGVLLVDAVQCYGPDFELLFACHKGVSMDSSSGCLTQSIHSFEISPHCSPSSMTGKSGLSSRMNHAFEKQDEMEAYITVDIEYINDSIESDNLPIIKMYYNSLHLVVHWTGDNNNIGHI